MQSSAQGDLRELGHGVATALGTALLGLWVFMLGVTAVYFHSPEEKLSGLGECGHAARDIIDLRHLCCNR
jgi:hypothetical protein